MITIIDYGMGNLRSVQKSFERIGLRPIVTDDPKVVAGADGVVLPGVGAFRDAMKELWRLKMIDVIYKTIEADKPFLGICLGLQLLFDYGTEFGKHKGLGIFRGQVVRFLGQVKVPHMGWDQIKIQRDVESRTKPKMLSDVEDGAYVYFVHSYYPLLEDANIVATLTDYGGDFVSSVSYKNLFASQFHPEKSQRVGRTIFANFASAAEAWGRARR